MLEALTGKKICAKGKMCQLRNDLANEVLRGNMQALIDRTGNTDVYGPIIEQMGQMREINADPEIKGYMQQKQMESAAEATQKALNDKMQEVAGRRTEMAKRAGIENPSDLTTGDLENSKTRADDAYNAKVNENYDEKMHIESFLASDPVKQLEEKRDEINAKAAEIEAQIKEIEERDKKLANEAQAIDSDWMSNSGEYDLDKVTEMSEKADEEKNKIELDRAEINEKQSQLNDLKAQLAADEAEIKTTLEKVDAERATLNDMNREEEELKKQKDQAADDVKYMKESLSEISELNKNVIKRDKNGKFSKKDIDRVRNKMPNHDEFKTSIAEEIASVDKQISESERQEDQMRNEVIESQERREAHDRAPG